MEGVLFQTDGFWFIPFIQYFFFNIATKHHALVKYI